MIPACFCTQFNSPILLTSCYASFSITSLMICSVVSRILIVQRGRTPIVSHTLGFGLCCRFPNKIHASSCSLRRTASASQHYQPLLCALTDPTCIPSLPKPRGREDQRASESGTTLRAKSSCRWPRGPARHAEVPLPSASAPLSHRCKSLDRLHWLH